jgi:hypothetical protein
MIEDRLRVRRGGFSLSRIPAAFKTTTTIDTINRRDKEGADYVEKTKLSMFIISNKKI